jgi:hypothetical protein
MQTFLPCPNYWQSAQCLDNKRLGKQRLECKQILLALGLSIGQHTPGKRGWTNHPAVCMWRGYEPALIVYAVCMCAAWRKRNFKDSLGAEFVAAYATTTMAAEHPPWLGDERIHASHRSNLLRKDSAYYAQFDWKEPDNLPYVWPVTTRKDFDDGHI